VDRLGSAWLSAGLAGKLDFVWSLEFRYFAGGLLGIFVGFLKISVDFGHFWASFFLFSLFSDFQIRYTRTQEARLYYSSAETSTEARQLGPRGYRVVQSVDLGFGPVPASLKSLLSTLTAMY
jgi:hypothetical protein